MQRSQIRAGRALLEWSQEYLAEISGVPLSIIHQLEPGDWSQKADQHVMDQLQSILEKNGVEFIPANNSGGPGVRLKGHGAGSETVSASTDEDFHTQY